VRRPGLLTIAQLEASTFVPYADFLQRMLPETRFRLSIPSTMNSMRVAFVLLALACTLNLDYPYLHSQERRAVTHVTVPMSAEAAQALSGAVGQRKQLHILRNGKPMSVTVVVAGVL
jgi:hypothetical protein